MKPTFCEECANVEAGSRKGHPAKWLCVRFPRLEVHGYFRRIHWA